MDDIFIIYKEPNKYMTAQWRVLTQERMCQKAKTAQDLASDPGNLTIAKNAGQQVHTDILRM